MRIRDVFAVTLILFAAFNMQAQVRIPKDYTFYKGEKTISYEKAMKYLVNGGYVADIRDSERVVVVKEVSPLAAGDPFPFRDFKDIDGNTLTPDIFRGKPVVVNFWFMGCAPCIREIPELNQLVEKYQGEPIVFLALGHDPAEKVEPFLRRRPFAYTIVPDQLHFTLSYGITIYPTHVFVNREGIIEDIFTGYSEGLEERMNRKIEALLKTK